MTSRAQAEPLTASPDVVPAPSRPAAPSTRHRGVRHVIAQLAIYVVLLVAAAAVLFPVYYAIAGSVMGPRDLARYPPALVPHHLRWGNLAGVFDVIPLGRQYLNSAVQAGVITLAQLVTSVLAAYAFAFLSFRWRSAVFGLFLATLMVPWEAIILPNYLLISGWGLADTRLGLVLPFLVNAFGTFLLRQSFLQFPRELRDASKVDGCGDLRFLWRILVPLQKPALAAVAVYVFLSAWNQYFWPLLITSTPRMQTLQIGITQLQNAEAADPGLVLAGVTLSLLPTLLLVVFGQRFIVRGLVAGASR
jgi:sn-glycerol 3-phosphate transport system permease protein